MMEMNNDAREIKVTVVGDGCVGKTCLLWSFVHNRFPHSYIPTVFENETVKTVFRNESYVLQLFDTGGQEEWDTLRILAYPSTDVVILCFCLVVPSSKENITQKWIPELKKHLPRTPVILVGTQCDLRMNSNETSSPSISTRDGELLRKEIQAFKYIECSALTKQKVQEVFETCIEACLDKEQHFNASSNKKCKCCSLS